MSPYVAKIGSLRKHWIPFACCFLMFSPLPLGLRTAELSLLGIFGLALAVANGSIGTSKLKTIGWFLLLTCLGTVVSVLRGESFSLFQFFRGVTFCLIGLWLAIEKIDDQFFAVVDRMIPVLILGGFLSAFLYFGFGLDYYNSQLDIPFDLSEDKRIYVFPSLLFLVLFVEAALSARLVQFLYLVLIVITVSKTFFIVVVLTYLLNIVANKSLKATVLSIVMLIIAIGLAIMTQLPERIGVFVEEGDPWRTLESLAALDRLVDPIRLFFGNGAGVPYWGGRGSVVDYDEVQRVVENSFYDVHNGFLTLLLRFGLIGASFYVFLFSKSIPRSNFLAFAALSGAVVVNIFLSHGPVQTVEVLGLVLGLRLVQYRERRSRRAHPELIQDRGHTPYAVP
jgi:hypothetical protein